MGSSLPNPNANPENLRDSPQSANRGAPGADCPSTRDRVGRFRMGSSGNPAGRPRGSRNRNKLECAKWAAENTPHLLALLPQLAVNNPAILKFVLDRITPRDWRPASHFEYGLIGTLADIDAAVARAFSERCAGELDDSDLGEVLDNLAKARAALGGPSCN